MYTALEHHSAKNGPAVMSMDGPWREQFELAQSGTEQGDPMTATTASSDEFVPFRGTRLPLGLAGVAAVASLAAAMGGGTVSRLLLALSLPAALGVWMQSDRRSRPPVLTVGLLMLLATVGTVHVGLTSPAAAWAVDSHMVPQLEAMLPPGGVRVALAWSVPLLWAASFAAVAVEARQRTESSYVFLLPLVAGFAPLATSGAFPTDAYHLLWDSTAFGHAAYAVGACAIVMFMMWPRSRAGGPEGEVVPIETRCEDRRRSV